MKNGKICNEYTNSEMNEAPPDMLSEKGLRTLDLKHVTKKHLKSKKVWIF